MPGVMIAMGRLNRPAIMVYGGTIKPGYSKDNEPLDIVSAFQSYGMIGVVMTHAMPHLCPCSSAPRCGDCTAFYCLLVMHAYSSFCSRPHGLQHLLCEHVSAH